MRGQTRKGSLRAQRVRSTPRKRKSSGRATLPGRAKSGNCAAQLRLEAHRLDGSAGGPTDCLRHKPKIRLLSASLRCEVRTTRHPVEAEKRRRSHMSVVYLQGNNCDDPHLRVPR